MTITRKRAALWGIAAVSAIALGSLLARTTYAVKSTSFSEAFCNAHECQIFISQSRYGWGTNGFQDIGGMVLNVLWSPYRPTHGRLGALVFRVAADGIQEGEFTGRASPFAAPDGSVYLSTSDGKQWAIYQWKAGALVRVTADEELPLTLARRSGPTGLATHGWTHYYLNDGKPISLTLDGSSVTIGVEGSPLAGQSLEVSGTRGQTQKAVWPISERVHRVSRDQYYSIFGPDVDQYRVKD